VYYPWPHPNLPAMHLYNPHQLPPPTADCDYTIHISSLYDPKIYAAVSEDPKYERDAEGQPFFNYLNV